MHKTRLFIYKIIALLLSSTVSSFALPWNSALGINKCTENGQVTYSDMPCPANATSTTLNIPATPPNDPEGARQRALSDQKKIDQLNQQKEKAEQRDERRNAQLQSRAQAKAQKQEEKCKELDIKRQLAQQYQTELQMSGDHKSTEKAKSRVRIAENNYQLHCKPEN